MCGSGGMEMPDIRDRRGDKTYVSYWSGNVFCVDNHKNRFKGVSEGLDYLTRTM